jgi:lysozyme
MDKYKNAPKYAFTQLGSSDVIKEVMLEEGFRTKVYSDTNGKKTIGFGFNLDEPANKTVLEKHLGKKYDMQKMRNGEQAISKDDAFILLTGIIKDRNNDLKKFFGRSWNKFNQKTKNVLVNMAYQMGMTSFRNFSKMIAALKDEDYDTAAKEMLLSRWAKETPRRAKRLAEQMRIGNGIGHSNNHKRNKKRITEIREGLALQKCSWSKLHHNAQKVLLELSCSLRGGVKSLLGFKNMINALKQSDYKAASKEILNSSWARNNPQKSKILAEKMEQADN